MYGKDMIFKMSYLMTYECNLFEICKEYCRLPLLLMTKFRLLGVTVVFVHETIRVMNKCHSIRRYRPLLNSVYILVLPDTSNYPASSPYFELLIFVIRFLIEVLNIHLLLEYWLWALVLSWVEEVTVSILELVVIQ